MTGKVACYPWRFFIIGHIHQPQVLDSWQCYILHPFHITGFSAPGVSQRQALKNAPSTHWFVSPLLLHLSLSPWLGSAEHAGNWIGPLQHQFIISSPRLSSKSTFVSTLWASPSILPAVSPKAYTLFLLKMYLGLRLLQGPCLHFSNPAGLTASCRLTN